MLSKVCNKCLLKKEISKFYKNKQTKDGLRYCCILCCKNYALLNAERIRNQKARYYKNNKQKIINQQLSRYTKNKPTILLRQKKYAKNRRSMDIAYKLSHSLRNRMNSAIKNNQKSGSAVKDLGCSILELGSHLEKQFKPGMSWSNWGKCGWHIDHIIPLSKFNLRNKEEFLKACHYTNLQPLWAKENLRKSDFIDCI